MKIYQPLRKSARIALLLSVAALGVAGITSGIAQVNAASVSKMTTISKSTAKDTDESQALQTLNSFYKPALKGQFPGGVSGLTVGVSTRKDVEKKIGEPDSPSKNANDFDVYTANMGHPGYAVSYKEKENKIHELRYFGTNVERQTNIGGITEKMLKQHWGKPDKTKSFKTGKQSQIKWSYNRGDYVLEFIFNDAAHLDHINLVKKAAK
ncbi:YjgB family protein [Paenibacillus sp. GCM10012307]|uniref:YjgB family protein n=2 Tax=Paenibacillus roseus TaxID=2798579 RepID=A0A934MWK4_9BACL|nr:YjgB family protein [Paenibacillus roseus]